MGTHWKNLSSYDYLGAYSLECVPNKEVILTIKEIKVELVTAEGGKRENCIVARFEENQVGDVVVKPMVLNKTNCKTIESIYGPEIEGWIGKSIIVFATECKFQRDQVPCLRVRKEKVEFKCSVCGKEIERKVYTASVAKYGVALCSASCLEAHNNKKNNNEESEGENN